MRIIHIVDTLDPAYGGPAVVAPSLAATQASLGHEVYILSNTLLGAAQDVSAQLSLIPGLDAVHIADLHAYRFWQKLIPLRSMLWLRRMITADTIVHLHGVWEPILWYAARLCRMREAVYVSRPCSMLHPWQMTRYIWQKKIVFALGAGSMLRNASFVHALNEHEADFVTPYIGDSPVETIPNGYFPESIHKILNLENLWHRHPQLAGKPYILFLSRLHYQKGVKLLLEGFRLVAQKNSEVLLVLTGPDGGERECAEAFVKLSELESRVVFTGPLYGKNKSEILSGATCYCLPSLNEGFSNALIEALAYGLPVVTTKGAFFPEVEDHGAGKVVDSDPQLIAKELVGILSSEEKQKTMSLQATKLVRENYTWKTVAERTLLAYRNAQERRERDKGSCS